MRAVSLAHLKLGRPLGPSTHHGLRMATFVDKSKLDAPPFALDNAAKLPASISLYGNDRLGDCTCATWAGLFKTAASANSNAIDFADAEVEKMYRAGGYDGTPATDNGWTLAGAAGYAQHTGLVDTAGTLHQAGPWMQIRYSDMTEVMIGANEFGPMPVGVALPIAAQHQDVWDTDGGGGDQTPNGWGGHSLTLVGYDHDGVTLLTWGARKRATWNWWNRYVDEAVVAVDPLWLANRDTAPNGFAIGDLVAALEVLR